jgi:hypothetical protein
MGTSQAIATAPIIIVRPVAAKIDQWWLPHDPQRLGSKSQAGFSRGRQFFEEQSAGFGGSSRPPRYRPVFRTRTPPAVAGSNRIRFPRHRHARSRCRHTRVREIPVPSVRTRKTAASYLFYRLICMVRIEFILARQTPEKSLIPLTASIAVGFLQPGGACRQRRAEVRLAIQAPGRIR